MSSSIVLEKAFQKHLQISGLTFRSQEVRPGFIFFALKGVNADGNLFIDQAIARGAVMVVSSFPPKKPYEVFYYQSEAIDRDMADAAYEFYGQPSDSLNMIGITGTKGKTSIAYLLESILASSGRKVGVLGTINYRVNGKVISAAPNTTPASLVLFGLLSQIRQQGCRDVVMEVSSHALELQRVRHIWYDTAVFTNLQRDHLDFHHTFENYFQAKQKLFENLADKQNPKPNRIAVINVDDPYGRRLLEQLKGKVKTVTFAIEREADFKADSIEESLEGTSFMVNGTAMRIRLLGRHNVYNALGALAAAWVNGVEEKDIIKGLADLPGVPGRMERIDVGQNFYVFVDFAYTDESLQRAFDAVLPFRKGRIFVVFGCGGERDRTKRPLMGHTACSQADSVFLTNDNPRGENPQQIFDDILKGMDGFSNYQIIPDRDRAIAAALSQAREGDIVIIAGKGHEEYQLVGTEKRVFSDKKAVLSFFRREK